MDRIESEEWKEVKHGGEERKDRRPWVTERAFSCPLQRGTAATCPEDSVSVPMDTLEPVAAEGWAVGGKGSIRHWFTQKGNRNASTQFSIQNTCIQDLLWAESRERRWLGEQELVSARPHLSCVSKQPSAEVKLQEKQHWKKCERARIHDGGTAPVLRNVSGEIHKAHH